MTSSSNLVSVYIPTKNRLSLAIRAINSVLNQTHQPIEIIVVDDCSELAQYQALCAEFVDYDNVHFSRNSQPLGACATRNKAINRATGEFVTGLDDDDYFKPHRIATLLAAYDDKYAFVCDNNSMFKYYQFGDISVKKILKSNYVGNQIFTQRYKILALNGYDENFPAYQDYDLWVRLIERFGKAKKIQGCSQIINTSRDTLRISDNSDTVRKAVALFLAKHAHLYAHQEKSVLYVKVKYAHYYKENDFMDVKSLIKAISLGNTRINIMILIILFRKFMALIQ
ncbi:Glycosyltransferase PglI [uncultured Candidatus Thioglobus sp.]|nr:Glycosyltransferase PglI [uncultured Candidatus Thioglobus sp.]